MTKYEVHPRERFLRVLLGASPLLLVAWVASLFPYLIPAALVTTLYVLGGIAGGGAAMFYTVWAFGWLTEGSDSSQVRLIGDSCDPPRPYFPWLPSVRAERRSRRIAALERDVGLGPDGRFYRRERVVDPLDLAIVEAMRAPIADRPHVVPVWNGPVEFAPAERLPPARPARPARPHDMPPTDEEWQATFGKQDDAA